MTQRLFRQRYGNNEVIKKALPLYAISDEDRIAVLHTCYARMATLNAAAQLVYANDYAKQKQFVYMPGSENGSGIQTFEGSVAAGHTATIAEIDYDEDNVFTFTNTGSVALSFCCRHRGT
ncbi:hypothetical protein [Flavobacterium sp.]|uniref:hypothetical protein n=1 Tax=Flavobacterium sp. TaxID=239 RepID=UPI00261C49AF|nr:hypothetical protein [Flavobacterium sp.]